MKDANGPVAPGSSFVGLRLLSLVRQPVSSQVQRLLEHFRNSAEHLL